MKVRLNKRVIDEASYQGPGSCYLWDTELSAFGVRIYPTGRKSFVVSYWSRGRRRFYTLGRFGRLTVQQAREAALEVFLQVRRGEDPSVDHRSASQAPAMADLADRSTLPRSVGGWPPPTRRGVARSPAATSRSRVS